MRTTTPNIFTNSPTSLSFGLFLFLETFAPTLWKDLLSFCRGKRLSQAFGGRQGSGTCAKHRCPERVEWDGGLPCQDMSGCWILSFINVVCCFVSCPGKIWQAIRSSFASFRSSKLSFFLQDVVVTQLMGHQVYVEVRESCWMSVQVWVRSMIQ